MSTLTAQHWLERIRELPIRQPIRIMNVCGGHERSISMAGLRSLLPADIELIPGPGCPVCVCPEEDIRLAIHIALHEPVILLSFGDMLRVPVNRSGDAPRSLEQARAAGADVRPIASPDEALHIATANPASKVIFFAAGFETTMAPIAAMIAQGCPENLQILLSGRLTWPAVAMLLNHADHTAFDCLIAPGHVASIMGAHQWSFVAEQHHLPVAVAGFSSESLLMAFYYVITQHLNDQARLENCYTSCVTHEGNLTAQRILQQVFRVTGANWRGIGELEDSGFELQVSHADLDARQSYAHLRSAITSSQDRMPAGCECHKVVLGQIRPDECQIYARTCQPTRPIGPCMVSDEGACRIWWNHGIRENAATRPQRRA